MCVYGILQLGGTIEGEGFISDLKNNKNLEVWNFILLVWQN